MLEENESTKFCTLSEAKGIGKMKKSLLWFMVLVVSISMLSVFSFSGCKAAEEAAEEVEEAAEEVVEEAAEEVVEEEEAAEEPIEIALIVKSVNSEFWQNMLDGGEKFDEENDNVNVTPYGPDSETDTEGAITILENVVTSVPDAIVIASQAGEGAVPAVDSAMSQGIPVITTDTIIPTKVVSHLATDNKSGGMTAADAMVAALDANGIEKKGTIVIMHVVVCDTDTLRGECFDERMQEIAPDITIVHSNYTDDQVEVAMTTTEELITAYDDLIGIFGIDYNIGEGIALAIEQADLQDEIMVVAFDDSEAEIEALKKGVIKALIVQDPYKMGYLGCGLAVKALNGEEVEEAVDTGVKVVLKEDV
jgi:ribose transport system substrate-binding protein